MTHVVVIEDDPTIAALIGRALEGDGYATTALASGKDAIRQVRELQPDTAVIDLLLPDGNGIDIAWSLRAHPQTAHIGLVVCTGARHLAHRYAEFFDATNTRVLEKPFTVAELLEAVSAAGR